VSTASAWTTSHCASRAELERLADALRKAGVRTRGIQRDALGPALVCFRDPDNIAWECFQDD
jgi:hypothetical protein